MIEKLNEQDNQLIYTVNEQVGMLLDKSAGDTVIINTLIDFIPDVKCLLNSHHDKLLELNCMEYENFAYFATLIEPL